MGVYKDLKTEIIGNRATARCTGCLYMGHAANATRHCPFALLKKSYEKACKGLPKTRWLTEKDKGNVNKDKVVWILNEIRRLRIPAHPQDVTRLEDLITNWHALDDKTGKPQHLS